MSAIALAVLQPQCGRGRPPPPATAAAAAAATRRGLRQPQTGQRTDWSCACIGRLAGAPRRSAVIGNSSRTRSSRRRRPQGAAAAAGAAAAVDIAIEPGPANSRCIWAGVDVAAPAEAVYAALTSYESLGTFIPGLAENRCLERHEDGCTLLQAGQQDVALGVKFCARVCLRIREWPAGMPRRLLTRGPNANGSGGGAARWWPFGSALSSGIPGYFGGGVPAWTGGGSSASNSSKSRDASGSGGAGSSASTSGSAISSSSASGSEEEPAPAEWNERHWLRPRSPLGSAPAMDISFDLLEGDFAAFHGLWRVQAAAPAACRLSYSLFVRPQPWLPVGLVEQRVAAEIQGNLAAVRAHVQAVAAGG